MSNIYIPFYTRIWEDKKFRNLSVEGELVFIYFFSNKQISLTGIYEIDIYDTKIARKIGEKFDVAFTEILNTKMIEWDKDSETIFITNRFKLIPNKSAKVIAGAIDELNIMTHPFKNRFIEKYKDEINPYIWRLKGHQLNKEEMSTDEVVISASKIYNNKKALKNFLLNKGATEQRIDEVMQRVLPNFL